MGRSGKRERERGGREEEGEGGNGGWGRARRDGVAITGDWERDSLSKLDIILNMPTYCARPEV